MHSFHRLSILERATDHKCNNNCNRPKEMWVGFKCNGLIVFLREEVLQKVYNTCVSRLPLPLPPPPPASPPLLGSLPPLPPPPQLGCCWARHLWLWCSGRGVLSREGWSINYDSAADIFDGSGLWENLAGVRRWPAATPPPPPALLVSLIRDMETRGRGGGKAWPTRGPTYAQLVLDRVVT